jgi:hypothetical protein
MISVLANIVPNERLYGDQVDGNVRNMVIIFIL